MTDETEDRGRLSRVVHHPVSALTAGVGVLGHGLGVVDPLGLLMALTDLVVGTIDMWFPLLKMLNGVSGMLGFVPAALTSDLYLVGALVYMAVFGSDLLDSLRNRRSNDNS